MSPTKQPPGGRRSLFGSKQDTLSVALNDILSANDLLVKAATLQKQGLTRMAEWAGTSDNTAIQDVTERMKELGGMLNEQQLRLTETTGKCVEHLQRINDSEEKIEKAAEELKKAETEEQKGNKEMHRMQRNGGGLWRRKSASEAEIRAQMREVLQLALKKEKAEKKYKEVKAEEEVVKMYRFRHGMKGFAEAHIDYLQKAHNIYACAREIVEFVPAIATENVHNVRYEGGEKCRRRVEITRRSLEMPSRQPSEQGSQVTPTSKLISKAEVRRRSAPMKMGSPFVPHPLPRAIPSPPPPYRE